MSMNQQTAETNNFAVVIGGTTLFITSYSRSEVFIIEVPNPAPYKTLASTLH